MDSGVSSSTQDTLSKLSDSDRKELHQFADVEMQKGRFQQSIYVMTDMCFKKCVTGAIRTGGLDSTEESCTRNCVERFMDANITVVKHLEKMKGGT